MSSFSKTAMHPSAAKSVMHKPLYGYLEPIDSNKQSALRNHLVAAMGEFIGTYMFLVFAFLGHSAAIHQASTASPTSTETTIYMALSYSSSYVVNIWLMYCISGGFFNPAATLALVLCGELEPARGFIFFPCQLLAAILAAGTVNILVSGEITVVQTALATDSNVLQGLVMETLLTALLIFAALMMADEDCTPHSGSAMAIGLTYFIAELAGAVYTGASLNPARSLAPCLVAQKFPSYHWIYWVGPFLGALLASSYYHFVRYFNYWAADADQEPWGPSETTPLLQTRRIIQSPVPASPRSRRHSLADPKQRGANDSQERGDNTRKQHHPQYPYYRYRRDGQYDLVSKQEAGRRFSDTRIFERAHRQEQQMLGPSADESEQERGTRGKDKVVAVDP